MVNIKLIEGKGFVDLDKPEEKAKLTQDELNELISKSNNVQTQIITNLEVLPHIKEQIEALKESPKFKDLAEALTPIITATKLEESRPLSKQVQAIAKEEKKQKKSIGESLGGILGFLPGGNTDEPEPAPQPIYDPLVCVYCGGKLKPQYTKCPNCGAAVKPKTQYKIPDWIKPKHSIHFLDAFAGVVTFIIWLAATGWIIQSFHLTYGTLIGLAVFWLFFVVAFRLMIGGILD